MEIRNELHKTKKIFLLASEGYAADHLFSWFNKSINKHQELFSLLAHEGSRPKYFSERTRGERPDIISYCEFMHDMSMTFGALGDCYSFRIDHFNKLLRSNITDIPLLYLKRNPITWLYFYQKWRSSNMRMGKNKSSPLEWEWLTINHNLFNALKLKEYGQDDVNIWSFYQGLYLLNMFYNQTIDNRIRVERIEDIYSNKKVFHENISYLTKKRINLSQEYIDIVFDKKEELYEGEEVLPCIEKDLVTFWEDWQHEAYQKLVSENTYAKITNDGYDVPEVKLNHFKSKPNYLNNIFVSSLPKSGTHLTREIITALTCLKPFEPTEHPNTVNFHNYEDHKLISIPSGTFFSWHSIITTETTSLLLSKQAKPVFIVRNLVEIIFSFMNHLRNDIDSSSGKSVGNSKNFFRHDEQSSIYNTIIGFSDETFSFFGMAPIIKQLVSFFNFKKEHSCLIINYSDLINNKEKQITNISKYLNLKIDQKVIEDLCIETDPANAKYVSDNHVTKNRNEKFNNFLLNFHDGHLKALQFLLHKAVEDDTDMLRKI